MSSPNYGLIASSTFFIVPTIYGIYKGHTVLPIMSLLTTTASINYWLDPINPIKRKIDIFVSTTGGIVYFMYGYKSLESSQMRMIGYTNLCIILLSYNTSCMLYGNSNKLWIPFHIAFHYFSSISKFFVLQ